MFVFAHVFTGILIGLGFWHLTGDRRALPVAVFGALLPDLIDKSLSLLIPGIFGSGRTLGHTLLFFAAVMAAGLLVWKCRHATLLCVGCAAAIFSHQILDSMWAMPAAWFYPFLGPFPVSIIPDYVRQYLWLEITSPSEWVFAGASFILVATAYWSMPGRRAGFLTPRRLHAARVIIAVLFAVMGISLLLPGPASSPQAFLAPTYDPVTDGMAGLLALCGVVVFARWPWPAGHE
jgi:membrane-bound metal-dependent hydrolase YbcI (DUF457 family)